tara:strand:- start:249 stop:464 length:216 start_codon:yes stop_codon:yes gene_type:complete
VGKKKIVNKSTCVFIEKGSVIERMPALVVKKYLAISTSININNVKISIGYNLNNLLNLNFNKSIKVLILEE